MRKNSLLVSLICAMAVVLVAGRCSGDDEKQSDGASAVQEAAPADAMKDDDKGVVDSGVETDPLGGTIGGGDDMAAPVDDPGQAPADDSSFDDSTFEAEPLPEDPADL